MWTFTQTGFYSVVAYDAGRDGMRLEVPSGTSPDALLLVRCRARADLDALLSVLELSPQRAASSPRADYPHRAVLTRDEWARFLSREVEALDYPNFKSRVSAAQGDRRHAAYMRVWGILGDIEEPPRRGGALGQPNLWRDDTPGP